jgi:hypothetical protein
MRARGKQGSGTAGVEGSGTVEMCRSSGEERGTGSRKAQGSGAVGPCLYVQ